MRLYHRNETFDEEMICSVGFLGKNWAKVNPHHSSSPLLRHDVEVASETQKRETLSFHVRFNQHLMV